MKEKNRLGTIALLPPPNVTGGLHTGHFFCFLLTDILINAEYYNSLHKTKTINVYTGLDHAGIATEYMVKKLYGKVSNELIEDFKGKNKERLINELKSFNMNFDWKNFYCTDNDTFKNLSIKVLNKLVKEQLVYTGEYMINWCTNCITALADDEVEYIEKQKKLYYIVYMDNEGKNQLVATVRPETIVLDDAICIPEDYEHNIEYLINPVNNKKLRLFKTSYVDKTFGTSIMKLTANCSKFDKQIADELGIQFKRIQFVDERGYCQLDEYINLNISSLREKVLSIVNVEKIEYINSLVPSCYRCKEEIENRWSNEVFIKLKTIVIQTKHLWLNNFFPSNINKTIEQWVNNIQDWCISRSILNGQRIPICDCSGNIQVKDCTCINRVFDTWYTSALCILAAYDTYNQFPSFTITGKDIIFFWIIRMFAMTTFYTEEKLDTKVFLHGLLRDNQGRKLSKTLQNYKEITNLINLYGTDHLKLSLILSFNKFEDIKWNIEQSSSSICALKNKLSNIDKFLNMYNCEQSLDTLDKFTTSFLAVLNIHIRSCMYNIEKFNIKVAYQNILGLINEFSNFYLEVIKKQRNIQLNTLKHMFSFILNVLRVFTPNLLDLKLNTYINTLQYISASNIDHQYYVKKFTFLAERDKYLKLSHEGYEYKNVYG